MNCRLKSLKIGATVVLLVVTLAVSVAAESLTVRSYSSADGLANDDVNRIVPDSRGFVWFCTGDGLSRFDGYQFKNYTQAQGLPHRSVTDLVELGDGRYLVGTSRGLALFDPLGTPVRWNFLLERAERDDVALPLFRVFEPPRKRPDGDGQTIFSLERTPSGRVFAGTGDSVFELVVNGNDVAFNEITIPGREEPDENFNDFATDSAGDLWIASSNGIYRMHANGEIETVSRVGGNKIFVERAGRIWIDGGGNFTGIRIFEPGGGATPVVNYRIKDGLAVDNFTNAVAELPDGRIFVSSNGRLFEYRPLQTPKFHALDNGVNIAAVDRAGNVWMAIERKGVTRYSPGGFSIIDTNLPVPNAEITSILGDGDVFFTSAGRYLSRVRDGAVETIIPAGHGSRSWVEGYLDVRAPDGDWWIPSVDGVRRYAAVRNFADLAKTRPAKLYGVADGVPGKTVFSIFRDSKGFIWISSADSTGFLTRLDPRTGETLGVTEEQGMPRGSAPVAWAEDAAGGLWIGFYYGQLMRWADGRLTPITDQNGYFKSSVSAIMRYDDGSIWVTTRSRGVFRIDAPESATPVAKNYSTYDGFSTNNVNCVTSDRFGRLYFGTDRGINRFEPGNGSIRIFTQSDGLPGNKISQCHRDANGDLWFSHDNELIRYAPTTEIETEAPQTFIGGLSVNGRPRAVSDLGEVNIASTELEPDETRLQISFFAISMIPGEQIRYQWKIDGQDWSPPSEQRHVDLSLASGNYRFLVRTVNSAGNASPSPATFDFRINQPVWRRWWFILLGLFIAGAAVFALDRFRVSKTRQVETALTKLTESEIRFRTLADTASDAILTIDEERRIVFANNAIGKVFGFGATELIGRPLGSLMPETPARLESYLSGAIADEYLENEEVTGRHRSALEIPLEVSFGRFERDGRRFFTAIARDVSEKKRAETRLRRIREERISELERVRKRIATDLHDDIGSSLTQIAVLCEVARGQATRHAVDEISSPLERIRTVSRELVSVMSDIVWAINPQKDFLADLVQRMRRFASDVLPGVGIRFEFSAPDVGGNLRIGANIRREVFSIFKEAINNCAKYSAAKTATIELRLDENELRLTVADDGRGFDPALVLSAEFTPDVGGNGLPNIKRRCGELRGVCEIVSAPEKGTRISIGIPLHSDVGDFASPPE